MHLVRRLSEGMGGRRGGGGRGDGVLVARQGASEKARIRMRLDGHRRTNK